MNKNHPFVFLPTDKPSTLIFLEGIKEYVVLENEDKKELFEQGESYAFAYVLADIRPDEVGVWAYCPFHLGNKVFQTNKGCICNECKKIIATNAFQLIDDIQFAPMPQISNSSLAILVELKNKGINEVDVEYDEVAGKPYMAQGKEIQMSPDTILPKLKDGNIVCDFRPEKPENENEDELAKDYARIYAELKKDFDMEDESYYNKRAIDIYKAFIQGWETHRVLQDKDKKFTLEDMKNAISFGRGFEIMKVKSSAIEYETDKFIQSLTKEKEQSKK